MASISVDHVIDQGFYRIAKHITQSKPYNANGGESYIYTFGASNQIAPIFGGKQGEVAAESSFVGDVPIDSTITEEKWHRYIGAVFAELDKHLDLDFLEARWLPGLAWTITPAGQNASAIHSNPLGASNGSLELHQVPYITDEITGITLHTRPESATWGQTEVVWSSTGSDVLNAYVLLHEIGHALGLEHPHDKGLDEFDGSLAHPSPYDSHWSQTIMSYNVDPGIITDWNFFFSPLDIAALQKIWGVEDSAPSLIGSLPLEGLVRSGDETSFRAFSGYLNHDALIS